MSEVVSSNTFQQIFNYQMNNQSIMLSKGMYDNFIDFDVKLPIDSPRLSSYHVQQLMSEIGEVLDADKRWKNFRNDKYDKAAKAEELADCFIVLMNICMYSGLSAEDVERAIVNKLNIVTNRITDN
jgi:NTP pyrophosphatase (non-canonical NTP hydrolase)